MHLSVIIPAYNEGARIESSLLKATEYFDRQSYDCEILVVDDFDDQIAVENFLSIFPAEVRKTEVIVQYSGAL